MKYLVAATPYWIASSPATGWDSHFVNLASLDFTVEGWKITFAPDEGSTGVMVNDAVVKGTSYCNRG